MSAQDISVASHINAIMVSVVWLKVTALRGVLAHGFQGGSIGASSSGATASLLPNGNEQPVDGSSGSDMKARVTAALKWSSDHMPCTALMFLLDVWFVPSAHQKTFC